MNKLYKFLKNVGNILIDIAIIIFGIIFAPILYPLFKKYETF